MMRTVCILSIPVLGLSLRALRVSSRGDAKHSDERSNRRLRGSEFVSRSLHKSKAAADCRQHAAIGGRAGDRAKAGRR